MTYRVQIGTSNGYKGGAEYIEGVNSAQSALKKARAMNPGASVRVCGGAPVKKTVRPVSPVYTPRVFKENVQNFTPVQTVSNDSSFNQSRNESVSSDDGLEAIGALFQLGGALIVGGVAATWFLTSKVVYPVVKYSVIGTAKVTEVMTTKVVVPSLKFGVKTTAKGLQYVSTTTAPQVFNFTKEVVVPGVVKLVSDVVTFIKELMDKVFSSNSRPVQVMSQYRVERV